jgi:hypothetical protein
MTGYLGEDRPREREAIAPDLAPQSPGVQLFARIERLCGEEDALLRVPAKDRSNQQESRLREIGAELDRVWEKLRERAERLGRPQVSDS